MNDITALLLIPRLRIQNANAISGPLSWGFPAPSAFTGFVHALQRRLNDGFDLEFGGVGIVCHHFEPQTAQPARRRHRVFRLTRNPLYAGWKKFENKPAAIVEEGRTHMEISLLIEVRSYRDDDKDAFMERLMPAVHSMRLAGGSILPDYDKRHQPVWQDWWDDDADNVSAFRKLRQRLLPGFALVQREALLAQHLTELQQKEGGSDVLDALLDLTRLNVEPAGPDPKKPDEIAWEFRSKPGWLVPIPVGYAAISPLYPPGEVANARDDETPFRFVESLYSLGEWVSPHRVTDASQLFWRHDADPEAGIYCCTNHYKPQQTIA